LIWFVGTASVPMSWFPAQATVHLDAAYDSDVTRDLLTELGFQGEIARKGLPTPIQIGGRWVIRRTNSWMNGYGTLRAATPTRTATSSTSTSTSPPPSSPSAN
jgi:hypothetical protein